MSATRLTSLLPAEETNIIGACTVVLRTVVARGRRDENPIAEPAGDGRKPEIGLVAALLPSNDEAAHREALVVAGSMEPHLLRSATKGPCNWDPFLDVLVLPLLGLLVEKVQNLQATHAVGDQTHPAAGGTEGVLNESFEVCSELRANWRGGRIAEVVRGASQRLVLLEAGCLHGLHHLQEGSGGMEGHAWVKFLKRFCAAPMGHACLHARGIAELIAVLVIHQPDVVCPTVRRQQQVAGIKPQSEPLRFLLAIPGDGAGLVQAGLQLIGAVARHNDDRIHSANPQHR
mmetsp:Transcript_59337/g.176499  ORF Transcript_59337/g.176499 Transcript_59337/m.176499 type:complete len:288 (-) Transcript_59337:86-949(-)